MMIRWRRAGLLVATLAVLSGISGYVFEAHRRTVELGLAKREIARKEFEPARQRLQALTRSRAGGSGEVDYLLGLCEWAGGRRAEALRAFARIPIDSEFDGKAAVFQAEDLVDYGQLKAAEARLSRLISTRPPRADLKPAVDWLGRIYRMEARFDEVRDLLEATIHDADDPIRTLRELWVLDRGTVPLAGVKANLAHMARLAPDDDRVLLGEARVALLEGRIDEAHDWLSKCLERARTEAHEPDAAVWKAWLEWARMADLPQEARRAIKRLWPSQMNASEGHRWRVWLLRAQGDLAGERTTLSQWLEIEPNQPEALDRLAALEQKATQATRAAELRERRLRVDDALDRYRRRMAGNDRFATSDARQSMARLALDSGRWFDALVWCELDARERHDSPERTAIETAAVRIQRTLRSSKNTSPFADLLGGTPPTSTPVVRTTTPHVGGKAEFTDDAATAGLAFVIQNGESAIRQMPEPLCGGLGLLDYDGDGWLDVFVVQGGPFPPDPRKPASGDRLFRNLGGGRFADVTESAGLKGYHGYGHGVAVGDYDNDGWPDLFVTRWNHYALYRNHGDGRFDDVTVAAGLGGDRDWPTSAAFADLDGDGDLDLYVCHYLKWDPGNPRLCRDARSAYIYCNPRDFDALPDHLFRNDGGRFVDVTAQAGIADTEGRGLGVVAADCDGDGLIDLFVANDSTANFLWRNRGGFRFEEVAHAAGVSGNALGGYQAGMGVACGDLDGDGLPDLAVTNFYGESTTYYQNLGGGLFTDLTAAIGLAAPTRHMLGFGVALLDVNNDGHLDLMTANGHLNPLEATPYRMPTQLFLGGEDGRVHDVSSTSGAALRVPRLGRALAAGDLDNDGRLDAIMIDHNAPLVFLHNRTAQPGNWVTFRLVGKRSNRDAVGARVTISAGGRRQVAQRTGGGSYQSAGDSRLHFGLGSNSRADEVIVAWPSGATATYHDLRANTAYRLLEGEAQAQHLPGFQTP